MTTQTERARLAPACIDAALKAGEAIMHVYRRARSVPRLKNDNSPVTDADHAAEAVILPALRRLAPAFPVLSEEAAARGDIPRLRETYFLVDPLDGTREFLKRNGEFTVNIALVEQGFPSMGIVYAPAFKRLFAAWGKGTAFERRSEKTLPLRARPVPEKPVLAASRSHSDHLDKLRSRHNARRLILTGSSIKFCLIAAGEADIYPREGPTMSWDTAAGQAVLESAGGAVIAASGPQNGKRLAYPSAARPHQNKTPRDHLNPAFLACGRLPPPLPDASKPE